MENMEITPSFWQDKRVFVTGHTGFKGSWLTAWLQKLGASVIGYSLSAPTTPNHFGLLNLTMRSIIEDVRNRAKLADSIRMYEPEIVFHLAAQPLVRYSYQEPVETFETNVIGTANLLEACRITESVRAIVIITSDKCYENKEWIWGYRENDPLGGYDPYSASKGCAELVTSSYRNAFFPPDEYGSSHHTLIASCRAGNVIGGGDWGQDRLIPDMIKSAANNEKMIIRYPNAIRPWQHVLEPLHGYLLLGQKLLEGKKMFAEAWNFGSTDEEAITVSELVEKAKTFWPKIGYEIIRNDKNPHETHWLKIDCSKARTKLGWKPKWDVTTTLVKTLNWYREFYEKGTVTTSQDLNEYVSWGS